MYLWLADFCAVLITWGNEFRGGFGCDTMISKYYQVPYQAMWLKSDRALAYYSGMFLYEVFHFAPYEHQRLCYFFFLFCIACSAFLIQRLFLPFAAEKNKAVRFGMLAAPLLLFVNVFFSEYFMFPECFIVFGVMFLLSSAGCYLYSRKHLVTGIALIAMSGSFYQVGLLYAAIILTTFLVLRDGFVLGKKLVREVFLMNTILLSWEAIYMLITKLHVRLDIIESVSKANFDVLSNAKAMLSTELPLYFKNSLVLMPSVYAPLLVFLFCVISICLAVRKRKEEGLTVLLWLLTLAALALLIPLIQGERLVPRTAYLLYVFQAMLFLVAFLKADHNVAKYAGPVFLFFLTLQIVFSNVIQSNHYLSNQLDELYAKELVREISAYEEETGTTVTKLAISFDDYTPHYFPQVHYYRDQINESALKWTPRQLIPLATGRDFERAEEDEEIYKMYFAGRDWNEFNLKEQLIIRDDTAYWCVF